MKRNIDTIITKNQQFIFTDVRKALEQYKQLIWELQMMESSHVGDVWEMMEWLNLQAIKTVKTPQVNFVDLQSHVLESRKINC